MTTSNRDTDRLDRIAEDISAIKVKVEYLVESQKLHRSTHDKIDGEIDTIQIEQTKHASKIKALWVVLGIALSLVTGSKFALDALASNVPATPIIHTTGSP